MFANSSSPSYFRCFLWSGLFAVIVAGAGCRSQSNDGQSNSLPAELSEKLPSDEELRTRLDDALRFTFENRRLNLKDYAAWQIVHGILAFGRDFKVQDEAGELVSAVDHLSAGGAMTGWTLQQGYPISTNPPRFGLKTIKEGGSKTGQGHADQWLGYLSECRLPLDHMIKFMGRTYTIDDMLLQVEHDVPYYSDREYTWTIMGLTAYRPTTYEWKAGDGQKWSIAKLLEYEVGADLNSSSCGGTHRMTGMTMALNRHVQSGGEVVGIWETVKKKIEEAVANAKNFQNPDGSLSTNYFARPGNSPDVASVLGSTGHALEFVVLASTDEQLRQPWVRRAVLNMCDLLEKTKTIDLECGALYHASHGLVLYRQRLYGDLPFLTAAKN